MQLHPTNLTHLESHIRGG